MELKPMMYALVRYIPDSIRGEQVNLGAVVVSDAERLSAAKFLAGYRWRIRALNPKANVAVLGGVIESLKHALTSSRQGQLFEGEDTRITSSQQLQALRQTMANQIQLSEPMPYRATSVGQAVRELFGELVAPPKRPMRLAQEMPLSRLRELIEETVRDWTGEAVRLDVSALEEAGHTRHYADFWLRVGQPVAALFAIPEEPDERHNAWLRRDCIPTIAKEFRAQNPSFKAVAVFPPNGHEPSAFAAETRAFLGANDGVIVTNVDLLPALRTTLVPSML